MRTRKIWQRLFVYRLLWYITNYKANINKTGDNKDKVPAMKLMKTKITDIIKETSDTYSYRMEVPQGMTWKAGQHVLFKMEGFELDPEDRDTRVFSISSAPEDGFLQFTTRIGELHTSFKEVLLNKIKVGDPISVAEPLGVLDFHQEKGKSLVIAGGIGVTPVRSLLKHYSEDNIPQHQITVLYSDERGEFAYGNFWEETKAKMDNLDLHLLDDRDTFTNMVKDYATANGNDAEYLIVGSPGMNAAFTETLEGLDVEKENIFTDDFIGY